MKEILKQIWNGFSFPFSESSRQEFYQNLAESKSDLIAPEIDEETRKKNEMSQKIFDTVKKDLEKYPPHEWEYSKYIDYVGSYYKHKCVSYELKNDYSCNAFSTEPFDSVSVIFGSDGYSYLNTKHRQELYKLFIIPLANHYAMKRAKEVEDQLAEFLDDSKRIVCKENE